ncbi:hypothetical protein KKH59_02860 [Patescibacteria group bacterium]|nr:hypothetical protein [Patescibacteria group bacterium]
MALNASGTSPTGLIVNRDAIFLNGNVGIGTPGPEATLDVGGSMKLLPMAAQPFACAAAKKGALYFNSGTNKHYDVQRRSLG